MAKPNTDPLRHPRPYQSSTPRRSERVTNTYLEISPEARARFRNAPITTRIVNTHPHAGTMLIEDRIATRFIRKWLWDEERFTHKREE
jgi:hypothetical protein